MRKGPNGAIIQYEKQPIDKQILFLTTDMLREEGPDMIFLQQHVTRIAESYPEVYRRLFQNYLSFPLINSIFTSELFDFLFDGLKQAILDEGHITSQDSVLLYGWLKHATQKSDIDAVEKIVNWLEQNDFIGYFRQQLEDKTGCDGNILLSFSVRQNNLTMIKRFLRLKLVTIEGQSIGVDRGFFWRFTPLEVAVEQNNKQIFIELLGYVRESYSVTNFLGGQIHPLSTLPDIVKINYLQKAIECDAYDIAEYLVNVESVDINYVTSYYNGQWHTRAYRYRENEVINDSYLNAMKALIQIAALHNRDNIFDLLLSKPKIKLRHFFTDKPLATGKVEYDRKICLELFKREVKVYKAGLEKREDSHYRYSYTIWGYEFHYGYSAGEKKAAVNALLEIADCDPQYIDKSRLSKYAGPLKNSNLGRLFRLWCAGKGISSSIPKPRNSFAI